MRAKFLMTIAAGAFLFLCNSASAQWMYYGNGYDPNCPHRIAQLERNVAKYERDGRWNDARKERIKLADTRAYCGYNNRGVYTNRNRGWWGDGDNDRDDRWRDNDRDDRWRRHDNGRHLGWYKNDHDRDDRWRDKDDRKRNKHDEHWRDNDARRRDRDRDRD